MNRNIYQSMPNCLKFMSTQKVLTVYFSYVFGLVGFLPISENTMQVPIMTRKHSQMKYDEVSYVKASA